MAKLKDGIFGPASGSVGNVIISSRNGVPYIRSKPAKVRNPRTPKQLEARLKLSLLNKLLSRLKPVLPVGFPVLPPGKSARDVAYSINYPKVFKGEYPNVEPDYSKLSISSGRLPVADNISSTLSDSQIKVTWQNGSGERNHDLVMLVAYNPDVDQLEYSLRAAERRSEQAALSLPDDMLSPPANLHCWISFISPDGRMCSDSVYLADSF